MMKQMFFLLLISFTGAYAQKPSTIHCSYSILNYGAVGDGRTLDTRAIQRAIDDCAANGGGTVFLPAGEFVSGVLQLHSAYS